MSNKQAKTTEFDCIPENVLNEFSIPDFEQRVYPKIYYAIRERQGFIAKNIMGDRFNWSDYKSVFEEAMGSLIKPKYSLAQLLEYAERKFNMNLDDLILENKRSWARRQAYEEQQRTSVVDFKAKVNAEEIPY